MAEPEEKTALVNCPKRAWYSREIWLLAGVLLSYGTFHAAWHIIAYLAGLQRELPPWLVLVFLALPVLTLALLVGLAIRMVRTWRRHIPDKRQLVGLCLLVIIAIVTYLVFPLTRFGPPRYKTFTKAWKRYVLTNVDLESMRAWLKTLDPNHCTGDYAYDLASGATIEDWWPEAGPWAKTITPLDPHGAGLALDSSGHPAIVIWWSSGDWGLVVGPKTMQISPAAFSTQDDYQLSLGPGAYVWHER
jgi:hypothetical protein